MKVTSWTALLGTGESTWDTHFVWDAVPSGMSCKWSKHAVDTDEIRLKVIGETNNIPHDAI